MKIAYTSDIHLDFWVNPKENDAKQHKLLYCFIDDILNLPRADILIIAGDIGHYNRQNLMLIKILRDYYQYIVLTWGNHDLYLVSKQQEKKYTTSKHRLESFKKVCEELDGVFFLDGNVVEIEGVSFWGSGLWYPVEDLVHWRATMTDATSIITPKTTHIDFDSYGKYVRYRFDPYIFYEQEMQKLKLAPKVDIVVTHVSPFLPFRIKNKSDLYYRFNGKAHIARIAPKFWIFGHDHQCYDFSVGTTRLISCPLGYPDKKSDEVYTIKTLSIAQE